MGFTLILDVLIAVLLVVTIVYAIALNRQLSALRQNKGELEALIRILNEATQRAEEGITRLKSSSEDVSVAIGEGLDKADNLNDDLSFLIDRGTALADRLEKINQAARQNGDTVPTTDKRSPRGVKRAKVSTVEAESDAERELLKALRDVR